MRTSQACNSHMLGLIIFKVVLSFLRFVMSFFLQSSIGSSSATYLPQTHYNAHSGVIPNYNQLDVSSLFNQQHATALALGELVLNLLVVYKAAVDNGVPFFFMGTSVPNL